ncbi:hypothetical protein LCGC14_3072830, partial [marine sediment metagenome]
MLGSSMQIGGTPSTLPATTFTGDITVGTIVIDEDSGAVTLVDMSVSASPADGTEESYAFAIDGNIFLKLYSEADSAGAVDTMSVIMYKDIHVIGNNACLKLEDDSGNLSRIKTGNSQLTISADPDNAVASTDIVFEIDGVEVGRFQEGKGFQSVKGFATQLWDIAGANWETAVVNTEYYSPNQCGG